MIIYKATAPNGKSYIGKTTGTLEKRRKQHYLAAKGENGGPFQKALRKYGDSIKWEVLADEPQCELELATAEMFYIARHATKAPRGYNLTDGGEGASGYMQSEEHKRKLSLANKGRKHTEETRLKMSFAAKGRKMPLETRRKMSLAQKGRKFSDAHRRKLSIATARHYKKICM